MKISELKKSKKNILYFDIINNGKVISSNSRYSPLKEIEKNFILKDRDNLLLIRPGLSYIIDYLKEKNIVFKKIYLLEENNILINYFEQNFNDFELLKLSSLMQIKIFFENKNLNNTSFYYNSNLIKAIKNIDYEFFIAKLLYNLDFEIIYKLKEKYSKIYNSDNINFDETMLKMLNLYEK